MNLEQKVMDQMKTAMKAKDEVALRSLRALKSAILLEKTAAGGPKEIREDDEIRMVQKMVKQRKDALAIYQSQGREDLAEKEQEEIQFLSQFLPEALSPEALEDAIRQIMKETGVHSPADKGKLIGLANQRLKGKAEGKTIAETVSRLISPSATP